MLKKAYQNFRRVLPVNYRAYLSKVIVEIGLKPSVKVNNNQSKAISKGGMIISADFEMAWAFRYSKRNVDPIALADLERDHIPILLNLFAVYNIPITWATVGHLLLETCKKGDHDWMRRIPYFDDHWKYTTGDWYDQDPYSDFRTDRAWYAPDMMELILNSRVEHEIGCHSFSHIDCSDRICPADVIDDEIEASMEAAKRWGIKFKSFVFPGGKAGNYASLQKYGFQIYRKRSKYDLAYPYRDDFGLLVSPSTLSFGKSFDWDASTYIKRFVKCIDRAIKTKTIAHFWLHPSVDKWTLDNVIPEVLKYAAEKREKGLLWIGTMAKAAESSKEIV